MKGRELRLKPRSGERSLEHRGDQRELFIYFNKSLPRCCSRFGAREEGAFQRRSKPHVSLERAGGLGGRRGRGRRGGREQGQGTKGGGEAGDVAPSTGWRFHSELSRCPGRSRQWGKAKGSLSPRPPWQPRNVQADAHHRIRLHGPVPAAPDSGHHRAALGPSRGGGGWRAEAGPEGQPVGTRADAPACHAGRRQKATRMLLGRDNQRVQMEARSLLLISTSQGTGVPKPPASPGTAQTPKTQPREGQRRPGAQHPAAGPQAGISPPSCNSRKKYSENQGESTE